MTKLKKYHAHQEKVIGKPEKPKKSGIACTEPKCKGEMMIWQPEIKHPQLPLMRASCSKCGWRGWV